MNFENGFLADIHFDSIEMLKKGFSAFEPLLPKTGPIYEFNLRLHWTRETLSTQSLVECRHFIDGLCNRYKDFPVYFEFPFCTGEKAKYTDFPNCDSCAFFEADWCRWPRQMGRHYKNLQQRLNPSHISRLQKSDFESQSPMTWLYPIKKQFNLVASQLSKSKNIYDFGAGNGFITHLVQNEMPADRNVHAVDPFVKPAFENTNFHYSKELPETMPESWSLLSSLGDYHVPFDLCLSKNTLPRDIVFFLFPDVFGKPGNRTCLTIEQGIITSQKQEKLFDLKTLDELGYKLLCKEPVPSNFYDNTELRIYSLKDSELDANNLTDTYAWENNLSSKNAVISEDSLL